MNMNRFTHSLPGFSARRMFAAVLGIWSLGALYMPSIAATVAVDQQPLTLQPPIPPNITLMLDDSGSMAWDYMPDACYLNGVTCIGTSNGTTPSGNGTDTVTAVNNDAMIDASNNGLYYNPLVTYTPPVMANGTRYPDAAGLTSAWIDGFNQSAGSADLTSYSYQDIQGEAQNWAYPKLNLNYSAAVTSSTAATYSETAANNWACNYTYSSTPNSFGGFTFNNGVATTGSGNCTFQYYPISHYFQFSVGPAAGPTYTRFYVAPAAQGCGSQPNCFPDTDTSGSVAPKGVVAGQNIANWFAYYHTRILMAKSGLMTAFSTLDPAFRVAFGSIDGGGQGNGNYQNMPSAQYTYNDTYNGGSNYIAEVAPFDVNCISSTSSSPCTPGQAGTQRASFWNWISQAKARGGTPLRQALDAVGQYYQSSQPWTTMKGDPTPVSDATEIACRQAYTILTTDGFWNGNYTSATTLKAADTSGPTVPGPNGQSGGYVAAAPYTGGDTSDGTPSLADVATYYWKTDLRPTANEVPSNNSDPAFWQHMVTFTMGLGFTPTGISGTTANGVAATIADIFNWALGGAAIANFAWPTPASNSINNIADLAHAGVNGHGAFFSATNPQAFSSGLIEALKRTKERVGTGASLAANSTQLTNGTVAYQANYYTAKWKGDLRALPINSSTGVISTNQSWSAATQLNAAATVNGTLRTYPNRKVVTYAPPASGTGAGTFVSFANGNNDTTPPVISAAELNALGSSSQAQAQMVDYLRGDNTLEQSNGVGSYRNRETPLGDIVDSQPVYSGAPNPNEFENQSFTGMTNTATSGDNSFNAWAVGTVDSSGNPVPSPASQRETLVFVAANDGMLHAFDATTGNEVYAYLPGAVITGGNAATGSAAQLASLSNPSYGTGVPHQYYNDGELTIADVFYSSAWHTVLVGTTGRGPAEAVYALDITNPASITPLWERSANDGRSNSQYIGQMVGKPVIAKVQDGTVSSDWQVLIGNGYNSTSGQAALLEFNVYDGTLSVHTTTNRAGFSSAPNGLAAPVAWMDDPATGVSDVAYAGDLQGQVWRFPLATATTSGNGSNQVTTYKPDPLTLGTTTATGKVVFLTQLLGNTASATLQPQPITAGMLAGADPVTGNVWLFFGTGQYLSATGSPNDLTNNQVESWYGVIAQTGAGTQTLGADVTKLVKRQITYELDGNPAATPPTLGVRTVTLLPTPSDMTGMLGWYMNLVQPITDSSGAVTGSNALGERMVTPNQFQGNLLLGTTRIPVVTDVCNPSGNGWVMAVDPFTGTNPSAGFFLVNGGNGTVTLGGKAVPIAGVSFSSLPNNPIFVGGDMLMSFDNGNTSSLMTSGSTGAMRRVSWQELVNP